MKNKISSFIEDAIAGGWRAILDMEAVVKIDHSEYGSNTLNSRIKGSVGFWYENGNGHSLTYAEILLDPTAWQAVGKTRGWDYIDVEPVNWRSKWHNFIDYLADGKTINEALALIE